MRKRYSVPANSSYLSECVVLELNQQISHIQSSLSLLYAADQELGDYIKALQVSAENLRKSISDTDTKIGEIKENLQQNISRAESDLTARIEALSTDIHTEIEQINNTIVSLQGL